MEFVFDGLVTVVGGGVVGAYIWSVRNHFVSDKMPPGAWIISTSVTATTILMLVLTWLLPQPLFAHIAGLAIQLVSLWIFYGAIKASRRARLRFVFDPEHPHSLVNEGPYRVVRHPFYVSYSIFWFGWAVATWSIWAVPSVLILLWLYVSAARMEERNFAASPLSVEYADYKARTGFFLPKLG
jgi:protein-S-isoprenylcysteine O-methyltransferase Ste14